MLEFMPGSPFNDEKLTVDQVALLNAKYGLDKSVFVRFFNYVRNMVTGDFGVSYTISKKHTNFYVTSDKTTNFYENRWPGCTSGNLNRAYIRYSGCFKA